MQGAWKKNHIFLKPISHFISEMMQDRAVVSSYCGRQPVQADSQPKSSGLVLGRRPLGAILHSSNEPGELSQWLCHDDSTINIVVLIIIIIKANRKPYPSFRIVPV